MAGRAVSFEVVTTSEPGDHFDWALLRFRAAELMLNTAYEAHSRPPTRIAAHRDTALCLGCPDLDVRARILADTSPM
jgi:hypothetical protein